MIRPMGSPKALAVPTQHLPLSPFALPLLLALRRGRFVPCFVSRDSLARQHSRTPLAPFDLRFCGLLRGVRFAAHSLSVLVAP